MRRKVILILFSIAYFVCKTNAFLDPISLTTLAAGAIGWMKYDFLKQNTYCRWNECCSAPYLKNNIPELNVLLEKNLFGQHIVQQTLVKAIGAYIQNIDSSRKPLTISFHGTSGTGKNYVSDFLAASLYEKSYNSKYVHKFTAGQLATVTQGELVRTIRNAIGDCPNSLFIFDEIEKMPPGIFDSIVHLLDHHTTQRGFDFSKAIFIFLSNSAGVEISKKLKTIIESGRWRDETTLHDFERIAELGAYNVIGGLYRSRMIESHVIDHFVPFLPLELRHVEKCIKKEFDKFCRYKATDEKISEVVRSAVTFDETGIFTSNGCKRVRRKVEALCFA
ncbi:torsin-like protein [Toxorhynchites rutilus septentrionalis]|uniref:torsin-like protein n=1 Tax=Toxorhynchites rutilus septentrionalis TaxID=329112 RepID=UPI0024786F57|nr:torsin-like protein [Toxorhynchites rutilus septentrionalis]